MVRPGIAAALPRAPLRVLAYTDSGDYSGAEAFFCRVVEGLFRRTSFDLTCVAPAENVRLRSELEAACGGRAPLSIAAQRMPLAAVFLYDPIRGSQIRRLLISSRCDVLLVNLPTVEYGSAPLLSRESRRFRTVGLLHIHHRLDDLGFRMGGMRQQLAERAIQSLDGLCVLSPWARDAVTGSLVDPVATKVRVVRAPRPRVTLVSQKEAREQLRLPTTGAIVGIAGRISTRHKGHDLLIEAARILADRGVAVQFAVAGDGRDRMNVEDAIRRNGLGDRFHLLGNVEPIGVFLSAVDAVAIPSRFEGLPFIALEALQAGVPGIATAIDGLRQIWPEEWQVAPDHPRGLADGLERLLGSSTAVEAMNRASAFAESFVTDDPASDVERALVERAGEEARETSEPVDTASRGAS